MREPVLRPVSIFLCIFLTAGYLSADSRGSVYGTVTDSTTGEPIAGVNITILQTDQGTSTGSDGQYEFISVREGTYSIEFSHIGYEKKIITSVEIRAGEQKKLDINLIESFIELESVEVNAMRYQQTQEDTRTSIIQLRPETARQLPGAGEDIMRTLQAMPGVVTRSDFSSQMVIRGGGPDQNLIVMDDIEVFNPYRLYGLISMFNPETVSDIDLVTGGFSVRYGDRLSAVLDVTNREGRRDRSIEGNVNTNITNANIVLEGKMPGGIEGSYLISARRTYYDLIAGPIARSMDLVQDDVAFPNFTDFQTKLSIGPYDNHRFYINTLISRDAVKIISGERRPTPDSIAVIDQTDHNVIGASWHYSPSNSFYSTFNVSWYRNIGDSDFEVRFLDPAIDREDFVNIPDADELRMYEIEVSSLYEFQKTSVSQEISYATGAHEFAAGGGVDLLLTRIIWRANLGPSLQELLDDMNVPVLSDLTQARRYGRVFGYVKDRWRLSNRLVIEPGLRMDYYSILEDAYISPRISASIAVDDRSTVRLSTGRYLQSPGYEKIFGQTQFFDLTNREAVASLHPEEAMHYVTGIDRWLSNTVYMRVEGYLKDFNNLIAADRLSGTRYVADPIPGYDQRYPEGWSDPYKMEMDSVTAIPTNDARGYAYGVELFLEKQPSDVDDRLSGWVSYTYSVANREQYGRTLPFDFDQRHTVNVVMQYRLSRTLELGARWRYGSGFPHTPPVGIRPRISATERDGETVREVQTDSKGKVIFNVDRGDFSNRNTERLPDYSRLDVRLNWYTTVWGLNWLFYLDVINILNRKNVFSYRYSVEDAEIIERPSTMFPIIPTFGISFRF